MAQQTLHTVVSIGGSVDSTFGRIGDKLINLGAQANLVSQKIINFGKDSVQTFVDYDDLMRQVQAVGEFSDVEIKALDEINSHIAKTSVYSNKQAAEAEVIMGQYGMSIADIQTMLPSVLDLAMAGNIEVKDSIDYLYSSLMSLGKGTDYAETLTDQMAKTAAIGATDVDTLGDSLARLGSGAQMFAGGSTEILTILTAMSRFGQDQRGAAAGTWIRNFMLSLAAPAGNIDDIVDAMEQLGIAEEEIDEYADSKSTGAATAAVNSLIDDGLRIYDEKGKLLPALDIIRSLRDTVRGNGQYTDDMSELTGALAQSGGDIEAFVTSTEGLTDNALYGVFRQIFGRRGIATALNLISIGDDEWDGYFHDVVNSEGFAESMGETMQGGLGGALRELSASWTEFKTTIGEALSPAIEGIADWLHSIVVSLSEMDETALDGMLSVFTAIAALGPGLLTAGGALLTIGALCTNTGRIVLAVTALSALSMWLHSIAETEWNGNFGALELDIQSLQTYADGLQTKFDKTKTALSEFDAAIAESAENYETAATAFSTDLITAALTHKELTPEEVKTLTGYGEKLIETVKEGVLIKKGQALSLTDILFGDAKTPEEEQAFVNMVEWEDSYYSDLYSDAYAVGQELRNQLTAALTDENINATEQRAIQATIDRLNKIQSQIANALDQQEYFEQLHKAQSVSWESVEGYITENEDLLKQKLENIDKWWHSVWGEKRAAWQNEYDNAGTDAERKDLIDEWGSAENGTGVEAELYREYQELVDGEKAKYNELNRAALDVLMSGNDYAKGWDVLKRFDLGISTDTAHGILDNAFNGSPEEHNMIHNLKRGSQATDQSYVSFWMQNYNRFAKQDQRAAFDEVVTALGREYDFSKVLEGDTSPIASSGWADEYAAYSLLFGDASQNPEQYRFSAVVEADTTDAEAAIGQLGDTKIPIDIIPKTSDGSTNGPTDLGAQGVEVSVDGDTTNLTATIDAEDGQTLLEYISGDATNLALTITGQDGKTLTENVTGNAADLAAVIASYNGRVITVNIRGRKLFAAGGRADEASIFGEAGPEWAIPEEHSERTASLLDAAREASGFTWPELLARNGGLNASPGHTPGQIVYAPIIYANDATGVEEKLKEDKERFNTWYDNERLREDVEVYA